MTDVARVADVSVSSVSHVINGTRFVSEALAERVRSAMEELGYTPDATARSLRVGRTDTIGLVIPDNSNPFFAELARRIEDAGFEAGYTTVLANSDESPKRELQYVRALISKRVDGVILAPSRTDDATLTPELRNAGIPVVVIDREIGGADVVLYDNAGGGYDATRHLIDLGHTRIACVTGPACLAPAAQRLRGFRRAVQDAGLDNGDRAVAEADFHFEGGRQATRQLLAGGLGFTGLFAANDVMAIGAIRELSDHGISVPCDMSVIGFDDAPIAEMISPALTTIRQPLQDIADTAIGLLLDRVAGRRSGDPARHVLPSSLVIRESTAPPGAGAHGS